MSERGFTLIELMIVVAIVAILVVVAYPSYLKYTVRANRAEAQAYLMELAQRQQQYFTDARAYAANEGLLNMEPPDRVESNYAISFTLAAGPPPAFTVTATPRAGSPQVGDGVLTINNAGQKLRGAEPW
ncbi:type IV pilin protein [Kineobactrum salinum]|uniref:type IV pilin protein n=1 Tax=Kineobactrum salinum TaxID=2708301 RepID=UPI0022B2A9BA|nr:type IV pilin protein [Kineobactrum salinum]